MKKKKYFIKTFCLLFSSVFSGLYSNTEVGFISDSYILKQSKETSPVYQNKHIKLSSLFDFTQFYYDEVGFTELQSLGYEYKDENMYGLIFSEEKAKECLNVTNLTDIEHFFFDLTYTFDCYMLNGQFIEDNYFVSFSSQNGFALKRTWSEELELDAWYELDFSDKYFLDGKTESITSYDKAYGLDETFPTEILINECLPGFSVDDYMFEISGSVFDNDNDFIILADYGNKDKLLSAFNNTYVDIRYLAPKVEDYYCEVFVGLSEVPLESLINYFSAEDVFGSPVSLELTSSDYKLDTPGTYIVKYKAVDQWKNEATLTVYVTVTDYRPTIELIVNASDLISVMYSQNTTEANIKALFKVTDWNGETIPSSELKFDKPFNNKKIGETKYTLKVFSHQNPSYFATKEITINVKQDVPPVILISDKIIMTSLNNPLSYDSIVDVISYIEKVPVLQLYNLRIDNYEQYKSNYDKPITINYSYLNEDKEVLGEIYLKPESQEAHDLSNLSMWERLQIMWQDYDSQCNKWYDYFLKFFSFVIPSFFKILFGAM